MIHKFKNFILIISISLIILLGFKCNKNKNSSSSSKNIEFESLQTDDDSITEDILENQEQLENELLKDPLLEEDNSSIPTEQPEYENIEQNTQTEKL